MSKSRLVLCFIGNVIVLVTLVAAAQAQANRTFVSTKGSDSNTATNCGPSAPCRNFSAAISVTNPGGEVVALDSGGYGNGGATTVIGKAVTIDAGNVHAAVTTGAGQDSFSITAGSSDVVVLRGLTLLGGNHSAANGVTVTTAGAVFIEDCQIQGYSNNGVNVNASSNTRLVVQDSTFRDNSHDGILVTTSSGIAAAYIHDSYLTANANAGVEAAANSLVTVADSAANYGGTGFLSNSSTAADAKLTVFRSHAINNVTGIMNSATSTGKAFLRFAYCLVTQNATGVNFGTPDMMGSSPGTSVVSGNGTDIAGTPGVPMTLQ
jgi:hypothetical protein